jgi:DNA-binding NarL/FixJ family response regulator
MHLDFHRSEGDAGPREPRRRVFLVDDHPLVREGLRKLIEQHEDLCVCGEGEDVDRSYAGVVGARPDAVVIDLSLNGESGFELIERLRRLPEPPHILVLSMHEEASYAARAIRSGALGYVMKTEPSGNIITALREILLGRTHVSASPP